MINNIYYKNIKIIDKIKNGNKAWLILEDGSKLSSAEFRNKDNKVEIQCHKCGKLSTVGFYLGKNGLMNREYICPSCVSIGKDNPFYGKQHSKEFKERLSLERKGSWGIGQKNAMYGINVWDTYSLEKSKDIKDRISLAVSGDKNPFYGKTHTDEVKKTIAQNSKKWIIEHPEHLLKMIKASLDKQSSGFKSKIEKRTEEELVKRGIKYKYSKVLHRKYQYDFIIDDNILLEVNGDYWHGNPLYYGEDKKELNATQKFKKKQDIKKKQFAEEYGYRIYYIWETEVNNKDFSVIDKIEEDKNEKI